MSCKCQGCSDGVTCVVDEISDHRRRAQRILREVGNTIVRNKMEDTFQLRNSYFDTDLWQLIEREVMDLNTHEELSTKIKQQEDRVKVVRSRFDEAKEDYDREQQRLNSLKSPE